MLHETFPPLPPDSPLSKKKIKKKKLYSPYGIDARPEANRIRSAAAVRQQVLGCPHRNPSSLPPAHFACVQTQTRLLGDTREPTAERSGFVHLLHPPLWHEIKDVESGN
jgi:hypothetical protein